jgi:hypothetical protein
MIAQAKSFTNAQTEYNLTIENGVAVHCTCGDHTYRHHTCKHMRVANASIMAEIEKALAFLALKRRVEHKEREMRETAASYMRIFNSPW